MTRAGILRSHLDIQEHVSIQLVKAKCSADAIDGDVMFASVDEVISGFIVKREMTRGAMKRVHQACNHASNPLDLNLIFAQVDSEWNQLRCQVLLQGGGIKSG